MLSFREYIAENKNTNTLYVHRKVQNPNDIIRWAKDQGFEKTLDPSDLHVTIAFSKESVDWNKIGEHHTNILSIPPSKDRSMHIFGEDACVLKFESEALQKRFNHFIKQGATWDYYEYQPHISIAYEKVDISKMSPYTGKIVLGPEIFKLVDPDWKENL